jgi:hypothetical protein
MVINRKKKLTNLDMAIVISIRLQEKSQMSQEHNTVADQKFAEFKRQCQEMPQNTLELMKTYLQTMIESANAHSLRCANAVFSYPTRGGENDGNPALQAILSILPGHKLCVKENEYTKARAIWLCEDYRVVWSKKTAENVLSEALQIVEAELEARKQPAKPKALATAHYVASSTEAPKVGQIMSKKNPDGTKTTIVFYEGAEYANAMDWMSKAFNNSGKCVPSVQIYKQPSSVVSTPRPTRYVPPNGRGSFGQYV